MLPKLRLLQVGDLHLPSAAKKERPIDHKDRTFSVELRNMISRQPIKTVFKKLYQLLESSDVSSILFMGDLTDFGQLDGFRGGAAFIANALQLGNGRRHQATPIGVVPGNHDIDRELAKQPSMSAKFFPLNEALHSYGLGALPVERSMVVSLGVADARCDIILMNSCWGCGALEYIPEEFRKTIGAAIQDALKGGDPRVVKAYYDRQFDTPAFSDTCIADTVASATETPFDTLLLVVAHHNLLPQRMTRLAPYTELVNAGAIRASLLEAKRPILYLHGHIHTDPIEILSIPDGDCLVSISAPAAEAGFNVIEIVYTRAGAPLACHVIPWKFDQSGVLKQNPRLTVPLIGRRRRSLDQGLSQVYAYLLNVRQCYWDKFLSDCASFFPIETEARLQECIELLMADQSVLVENYEARPASWILEARI
jgi:hypothetical protein